MGETRTLPTIELDVFQSPDLLELAITVDPDQVLAEVEAAKTSAEHHYAHSLTTILGLGGLAARNALRTPEGLASRKLSYADYVTALGEMLNTDPDFSEYLDIDRTEIFEIQDSRILNALGQPMVDVIQTGLDRAIEAALVDPRMWTQVSRDTVEVDNAEANEQLAPGQLALRVSKAPEAAILLDGHEFWADGLGYREDLSLLQWHYRIDEHTMLGGSYSLKGSDEAILRDLFRQYGKTIPEGIMDEAWARHAIEACVASPDQAKAFVADFRRAFYHAKGMSGERHSVTDFLRTVQKPLVDHMFEEAYIPLAIAGHTGIKSKKIHELATGLLASATHVNEKIKEQLRHIISSETFDDDATRTMDFMIRYAVVMELRKALPKLLQEKPGHYSEQVVADQQVPINYQQLITMLSVNVNEGARLGLTFGGCTANNRLTADAGPSSDIDTLLKQLLDPFNLNENDEPTKADGPETWDWKVGYCRTKRCPTKPKQTEVGPCAVCRGCQALYDKGQDPDDVYASNKNELELVG